MGRSNKNQFAWIYKKIPHWILQNFCIFIFLRLVFHACSLTDPHIITVATDAKIWSDVSVGALKVLSGFSRSKTELGTANVEKSLGFAGSEAEFALLCVALSRKCWKLRAYEFFLCLSKKASYIHFDMWTNSYKSTPHERKCIQETFLPGYYVKCKQIKGTVLMFYQEIFCRN